MIDDELIREVQRLYPLLYFSCHGSHARRDGLGESDLRLLHHISGTPPTYASALARHLGLSRSRISEALKSLERKGLIERRRGSGRRRSIFLTEAGNQALTADDGLDPESIRAVLAELTAAERTRVIEGLRLLRDATRGSRA